jgi:hypothetical protein
MPLALEGAAGRPPHCVRACVCVCVRRGSGSAAPVVGAGVLRPLSVVWSKQRLPSASAVRASQVAGGQRRAHRQPLGIRR